MTGDWGDEPSLNFSGLMFHVQGEERKVYKSTPTGKGKIIRKDNMHKPRVKCIDVVENLMQ
eukprot:15360494-Ditylum_brightwellii.AAC.1